MTAPHLLVAHPTIFHWDEVQRFEREILSNPRSTELDASDFFHHFPKFLLLGQGNRIRREVVLIESETGQKSRVDFFRQDFGEAFWDIIEIKKPQVPAFVREQGLHPRPAGIVYDAINQAEDYRTLIDTDPSIRKQLDAKGISVFRPQILVVVGRSPEDLSPARLRDLYDRLNRGPVEFRTYDDILNFATAHYRATSLIVLPASLFSERSAAVRITAEQFIHTLTTHGAVSPSMAAVFMESLVLLEGASPDVEYTVSSWRGKNRFSLELPTNAWSHAYNQLDQIEMAAVGLGLYALASECQLLPVARAESAVGADYFVRPVEYATDNLHQLGTDDLAAVEFSGIRRGARGAAARRLRQKVEQISASRTYADKIVVVVDFESHEVLIRRA